MGMGEATQPEPNPKSAVSSLTRSSHLSHRLPNSCIEKVLSDSQHRPPGRAGRSQALDQDEIIASSGP